MGQAYLVEVQQNQGLGYADTHIPALCTTGDVFSFRKNRLLVGVERQPAKKRDTTSTLILELPKHLQKTPLKLCSLQYFQRRLRRMHYGKMFWCLPSFFAAVPDCALSRLEFRIQRNAK